MKPVKQHIAMKQQQKRGGPHFLMPYGAHKGRAILLVPLGYLRWVAGCQGHELARRATLELERRERIRERARRTT